VVNVLTVLLSIFVLSYGALVLIIWRDVLLVTFLPALRVARLRPPEALRGVG
jgi:ABC-type lipoprotein release transport system permease subunit